MHSYWASSGEELFDELSTSPDNPLENIDLIADPAKNFKIIMKDGVICKNTLSK